MAMAASSVSVVASASSKNYFALDARPLLRGNGAWRRVVSPAAVPLVRSQLPGPASSGIASERLGFSRIESSDSLGVVPISHSRLFKDAFNAKKESVFTCRVAESDAIEPPQPQSFVDKYPALVTGFFFFMWYLLNVIFNILNKKIYNYFPYPYFVSAIHLVVGVAYCLIAWTLGLPKRAPIDKALWLALTPVAFCHALGHVMTNVSFSAVAVSFTHTIKALEPFFNAAASQFILGQAVPLPLWLSLTPVVIGVSLASMTELSFNWIGFLTAMSSNVAFTYRNIFSKKAMVGMDSTNLYAYISILSLAFCIPPFIIMEGPALIKHGFTDVVHKVGLTKFLSDLFFVGLFYHLYNQLAINTLERVAPLTHAVGNVLKRVFVIGFSIIVFGNKISTQTAIGTIIAIIGVAVYSLLKANIEEKKKAAAKLA